MTLILTMITNQGILQAADSNLTGGGGAAGTSEKVFELGFAAGAVAVAGAFNVGAVDMATWMKDAIATYGAQASPSLRGFANELRQRLETEMTPQQKASGSLLHLAGYVTDQGGAHPEFHFVRNITGIDSTTGAYTGAGDTFVTSEDFWSRDYTPTETAAGIAAGGYQLYINGFPDGRIGYLGLGSTLDEFFQAAWNEPSWRFRSPETLDEFALFADLKLRVISTMFLVSDYDAPYIGGPPQVMQIPPIPGAVAL